MYNVCLRMLKHPHDAEDVLQLAFVQVFAKIETFKFEASVSAWIKRIVVNRSIDFLKKRRLLTTAPSTPIRHDGADPEPEADESDISYTVDRIKAAMQHSAKATA